MPLTITSTPTYPVVTQGARLSFSLATAGSNFVRLWCVGAPLDSKLRKQISESSASRVEIFAGDALPSSQPFLFQPDIPGRYNIVAQEYQRGATGFGGGYSGDPLGFNTETKNGAEVFASIDFGQKLTMTMGIAPDTATLVLYVWGDTIRATTFALHGERSPAIVNPSSPKAKTALLSLDDGTPTASITGLADVLCATALGNTDTIITDMMTKFTGHFGHTTSSIHAAADAYNVPGTAFAFPGSAKATMKSVTELLTVLGLHMNTDQARRSSPFVSAGIGTGNWHAPSAIVVADGPNALLSTAPNTMEQAYIALAELYLAYGSHAINLSVHGSAEVTYGLLAAPPLMAKHVTFLSSIKNNNPGAAPTENPGVPVLVGGAGMKAN